MMMVLLKDVHQCYKQMEVADGSDVEVDQHFSRRIFARAVFSAIEGSCECFRQQAFVAESNKIPNEISLGRLSVLAGETYYVTDDGEIKAQPLRIRFLDHVLLSLKSYAEAQGVDYRTKKGDQWHRIQQAVKVRHRITHPKTLAGLSITKAEIENIDFTLKWFLNEVGAVARATGHQIPFLA